MSAKLANAFELLGRGLRFETFLAKLLCLRLIGDDHCEVNLCFALLAFLAEHAVYLLE